MLDLQTSCKDRGAPINLCLVCPNSNILPTHGTPVKTQTLTGTTTDSTMELS